ncbi:MAG TPA: DUF4252 domain-containing protein [Puia sp.]|jgi:hypothetical protein|uniref:DUF4252 domain-containing protein n=1 Tax=Puia sp. TaxID=2045100 RepID=UPI002CFB572A|nr:DUF4252 domain-containing protein [Puia sp.]HVU98128.1 DUF4252 domain-containing protein [Puia sp.]
MKKIFFLLLMSIAASAHAQDDAIGRFFGKYLEDQRFTVVSVSPRMFRLMAKVNWDTVSADVKQTVTHLQSFRILSTESTPYAFYKEALAMIDRKQYEDLIMVRGGKDDFRFMIRATGNTINELLMIAVDKDGFTLMSFVGDIDLDRLSRLAADMDIKGMENLKNAKRK